MTTETIEQAGPGPLPTDTARRASIAEVTEEITNSPHPDIGRARQVGRQELQQVLDALADEGVEPAPGVTKALALDAETARALSVAPQSPADWLATVADDDLTGEELAARMREHALRELAVGHGSPVARQVLAALLQRAVDALAGDVDRIAAALRPRWDPAAATVAAAVKAGITSGTTPEAAIEAGDEITAAWRTLAPAVAELDRLHLLVNRLAFLCGYYLDPQETTPPGRGGWLGRSAHGPVPLRPVTERATADDRTARVGRQRSAIGVAMQAETNGVASAGQHEADERRAAVLRQWATRQQGDGAAVAEAIAADAAEAGETFEDVTTKSRTGPAMPLVEKVDRRTRA